MPTLLLKNQARCRNIGYAITLINSIFMVFEICLKDKFETFIFLHDLHLVLPRQASVIKAINVLRTVTDYYNEYGNTILCFITGYK